MDQLHQALEVLDGRAGQDTMAKVEDVARSPRCPPENREGRLTPPGAAPIVGGELGQWRSWERV